MNNGLTRRNVMPLAAGLLGVGMMPASGVAAGPIGQGSASGVLTDRPDGIVLGPGVHRVAFNTTVKTDLLLLPGARIDVAAGRVLTVLGHFNAPVSRVFIGAGRVDLNCSRLLEAHPEWWGAAPWDASVDCLPALSACLQAHPAMRLLPGDYYISDTWAIERGFCRIYGSGFRGTEPGRGTRIIVTSGRSDVLRIGPQAPPPTVNDYLQNVDLRAIALARSQPVDTSGGDLPAGLRAQYLLFGNFEQVSAFEHGAGFTAEGLVRTLFRDCVAFRSLPGRQSNAPWRGFLLKGMANIGLAGGNASLYLMDCNATVGGEPGVADPVGVLLDGAFADSYLINFETSGVATGIRTVGQAAALGARGVAGHADLHIRMPVIDQCRHAGIELLDTSAHAQIEIVQPYVAVAPGAIAGLRFEGMRGAATVLGGQLIGWVDAQAGGNATGLLAVDSCGLQILGLKVLDHRHPIAFSGCRGVSLQGWVGNPGQPSGQAAARLADCERVTVALQVTGRPGAFARGVEMAGNSRRIRIDVTGIDVEAMAGGAAARVMAGPASISAPGQPGEISIEGV